MELDRTIALLAVRWRAGQRVSAESTRRVCYGCAARSGPSHQSAQRCLYSRAPECANRRRQVYILEFNARDAQEVMTWLA